MTERLLLLGTVVKDGGMCPESSLTKDQDQVSSRGSTTDLTFLTQTQCSFHDTTRLSKLNCAVQIEHAGHSAVRISCAFVFFSKPQRDADQGLEYTC